MAVGITGDFLVTGPQLWRPLVHHFFHCADSVEGLAPPDLDPVKDEADLDNFENDWNYIVNHKHDTAPRRVQSVADRTQRLQNLFDKFVPKTMIARKYDTRFLGRPLLTIPRTVQDVRCDNDLTIPTRTAIRNLSAEVRAWADMRFDDMRREWQEAGTGNEPDRADVHFNELVDIATAAVGGSEDKKPPAFLALQRSATYPTLARLWANMIIPRASFNVDALKDVATRATDIIHDKRSVDDNERDKVLAILALSPFWPHLDELEHESAKYERLCTYIDGILATKGTNLTPPNGPADGSGVQHLLAYHNTPVSAMITFMLLYKNYPDLDFIFIHSGVDVRSRGDLVHYMQRDCTNNARCKVLISTFQLMGVGHNLYRASHVILLEQPRNRAIQIQAVGRVARGGQVQKTTRVQLYDGQSLPETVLRIRSSNRGDLTERGHAAAFNWDRFVQPPAAAPAASAFLEVPRTPANR